MGKVPRRGWRVLVVAGLSAVFVAGPSAAASALTIDSVKLNGADYVQTAPGGVFKASLTVTGGGWQSTRIEGGGQSKCANRDNDDDSDSTYTHHLTAAGEPGNYDITFTAFGSEDCKGTQSAAKVMPEGVRVTTPGSNPNIPARCGINVMLVLDKSGSIDTSGATGAVKAATRAFLDSLSGTGSRVSIIDFSSTATRQVGYTTVTDESIDQVFDPYLDNKYKPSGWTNWEDAFTKVKQTNDLGTVADLVVFMTDGDPTARNEPLTTGLTEGDAEALTRASWQADAVKTQGSHILALGVGAAVTKPSSASRLTAVSGFDKYPGVDFSTADYTLVQDFDALAASLRKIAIELCQASVSITKLVDEGDGTYRPQSGWEFSASVRMSAGSYAWVQPAPPPSTGPRTVTTGTDGVATFQWKPDNAKATSTVTLAETVNPGYEFVDANCSTVTAAPHGRTRPIRPVRSAIPSAEVTVGPNEYAKCVVRNRRPASPPTTGTIVVRKNATPQSAQEFPFTGTLGAFTLVDDDTGASASRAFTGLAPGTYTVAEMVPADWQLTGLGCAPTAAAQIATPQATITLAAGQTVFCLFDDTRNDSPPDPPEPPEPPLPPPPGPTPPVEPGQPPAPPPSTQLTIEKTLTRVARVGHRVRFSITVTNTGSVPATNVKMGDVPPSALSVSGLKSTAKPRIVKGDAIWNLGTLAPGESRTISGSVKVDAGAPGVARNLSLAAADNAKLVSDPAYTRILAQGILGAPPVTG